jgi:predicted esterase
MKNVAITLIFSLLLAGISSPLKGENKSEIDHVKIFTEILSKLRDQSKNELLALHYQSMLSVIESQKRVISRDTAWIKATIPAFTDTSITDNAIDSMSYLNRKKPLIIAWETSLYPKITSFAWLKLPKDWDPEKSYPLYVDLHGLWKVCYYPIDYMTYPYRNSLAPSNAYEDGYQLMPWGLGNEWYINAAEVDILNAVNYTEKLFNIDKSREYIVGHSMGGFGAWNIGGNHPKKWAAIGVHAGALSYGADRLYDWRLKELSTLPVYIVVGVNDGFYAVCKQAADTLRSLGNQHVEFVTFNGGHSVINKNVENMYLWLREFTNENRTENQDLKSNNEDIILFYPNPVESEVSITINLEKRGLVSLNLFDITGREVATIIHKEMDAGETIIYWNRGKLPSGIYTYVFVSGKMLKTGKLILY